MDRFALRVANLLVGNEAGAPALEFAMVGPDLAFSHDALIAVTGAAFPGVPRWQPVRIEAGSVLSLGPALEGCRGYLAIAGGFETAAILGSASVYTRAGFGHVVQDGDVLHAPNLTRTVLGRWWIDPRMLPAYSASPTVRVVPGDQASEFGRGLYEAPYTVTAQGDRMGIRLKGPALVRQSHEELGSHPVVPGTVQVPRDGQPIVLMADAQTIGGYPQVAHVARADLPLVAQLRPGDVLTFVETTLQGAHESLLARERSVAMLRNGLSRKLR